MRVVSPGDPQEDPDDAVKRKRLRPELLLMLDVERIEHPPLRNRPEEIRMLAKRYLAYFSRENHRSIDGFTTEAASALAEISLARQHTGAAQPDRACSDSVPDG